MANLSIKDATSEVLGGPVLRQYFHYRVRQGTASIRVNVDIRKTDKPAAEVIAETTRRLVKPYPEVFWMTNEDPIRKVPTGKMIQPPTPTPIAGHAHSILQHGRHKAAPQAIVVTAQNGFAIHIRVYSSHNVWYHLRRFDSDASARNEALYYLGVIEKHMQKGR